MKVYDLNGNEHEKSSVDANECIVRLGWTLEAPVKTVSENAKTGSKKKGSAAVDIPTDAE